MNYVKEWEGEHALREMLCDEPLKPVGEFFRTFIAANVNDGTPLPSVLDIGCGQGTNTLWLLEHGFKVCGFDSSPSAVQRLLNTFTASRALHLAHRPFPQITMADATKPWPYFSHSFDVALDVRSIENLNEEEAQFAYKQVGRALRHNGCFFTLTASESRPQRYTTVGRARHITNKKLSQWLKAAGMEIMHISRAYQGTLEDWQVVARKT